MTVEQALAHPTWAMGGKITIDSATLMNKGLELIEAHHLFGTPYDAHRRRRAPAVDRARAASTLCDGATLAHLGHPDMRVPISYALHHPERVDLPVAPLDLAELGALTFERRRPDAFPCLRLAREAAVAGGTAPCMLNAANEVAVHAFLDGRLRFLGIAGVIERDARRLPRRAGPRLRVALRGRPRRARGGRRARRGARRRARELVPRLRRLRRADHPARGRPLRRGEGGRHARRALLAVLPADARASSAAARRSTASARSRSAAT